MAIRQGFNHFPRIRRDLQHRTAGVVTAALTNIRERAVASMGGAKSGRTYGTHQASAPGEAPAILFGQLSDSIDIELTSGNSGIVYTTDEKGPHLEYGTINMEPRPWLTPAAEEERPHYHAAMRSVLVGLA